MIDLNDDFNYIIIILEKIKNKIQSSDGDILNDDSSKQITKILKLIREVRDDAIICENKAGNKRGKIVANKYGIHQSRVSQIIHGYKSILTEGKRTYDRTAK